MTSPSRPPDGHRTWREAVLALLRPPVLRMLFLGFSAGLPILLIFSTLSVWLREAGVDRATVTFFSWAALGYSFKFVWAPLIDRLPVPGLTARLGRRRAWLLVAQGGLIGAMLWTSAFDPVADLALVAIGAVLIGFSAATQDIVIDAYRIEAADADLQSLMAAMYIAGYRVGMLAAGAGALWLAEAWEPTGAYDFAAWSAVYKAMAGLMLVGVATTLVIPELQVVDREGHHIRTTGDYLRFLGTFLAAAGAFVGVFVALGAMPAAATGPLVGFLAEAARFAAAAAAAAAVAWGLIVLKVARADHLRETYVDPFADFAGRYGRPALVLLALIGTYRLSDVVMGAVANVFYLDIGFTKGQIATYSKFWGLWSTILGGFLGGVLAARFGVMRALMIGAVAAGATNLLFVGLAVTGPQPLYLLVAIVADSLAAGMASAAFVAYLSSLTNVSFTAMQYAIFSSLMTLLPKIMAGYSGTLVDAIGYAEFFIFTAALTAPVVVLVWMAGRVRPRTGGGGSGRA
jgi:PAT family beta-lactamase induction signal transducer AmpG